MEEVEDVDDKDFNSEEILTDENNAPSLKYREAPYYIGSDSLQIFTKDFTVKIISKLLNYKFESEKSDHFIWVENM